LTCPLDLSFPILPQDDLPLLVVFKASWFQFREDRTRSISR